MLFDAILLDYYEISSTDDSAVINVRDTKFKMFMSVTYSCPMGIYPVSDDVFTFTVGLRFW